MAQQDYMSSEFKRCSRLESLDFVAVPIDSEPTECPVTFGLSQFQDYARRDPISAEAYSARVVKEIFANYWYIQTRVLDGEQSGIIASDREHNTLQNFMNSGIQFDAKDGIFAGINITSLLGSIETGKITTLTDFNPSRLRALVDVLHYHGIDVTVPDRLLDNRAWFGQVNGEQPTKKMLGAAAEETAAKDFDVKHIKGPLREPFETAIKTFQAALDAIHPGLPTKVLQPDLYQDAETRALLADLPRDAGRQIIQINKALPAYYTALANMITPQLLDQSIAPGTLDTPPFLKQDSKTRCSGAAFRMIMAGVTGVKVSEEDLEEALNSVHHKTYLHDDEYLELLQSNTFAERFGTAVKIVRFMGMDFSTLGTMAQRIKSSDPKRKVFVTVNLSSFTSDDKTIQHRAVLLNANKTAVILHDPTPLHGGAYQRHGTPLFIQRWAAVAT